MSLLAPWVLRENLVRESLSCFRNHSVRSLGIFQGSYNLLKIIFASFQVIHNYGHGGYGVTSAPGTAKYAVELLRKTLLGNSKL